MTSRTLTADTAGMSISLLCLIHCLLLPFAAALLPVIGAVAENEWIHRVLVLLALPVSLFAAVRSFQRTGGLIFPIAIVIGLSLIFAAAFVHAFHDYEQLLTGIGAVWLVVAHAWRWRSEHG